MNRQNGAPDDLALRRGEDLLRASVDWLWESDRDHSIALLSTSVATRLGFPVSVLEGRQAAEVFADRETTTVLPPEGGLENLMRQRRAFRLLPVELTSSSRSPVNAVISAVPFYDEVNGVFLGYRGTGLWMDNLERWDGRQNTSQRNLLALLDVALEQKDALEERARRQDSLDNWSRLGAIAHELRTPLNAILGFSEIIRDWRLGDAIKRYREYGGIIHDSGMHLLDVVNDLLELADAEKKVLDRVEKVDLTKVASFVIIVMEERAEKIGVSLVNALPPELPLVHGERRALRQIMINLLSNALRYTPTGGEVRFEAEVIEPAMGEGGEVLLHVIDSGIGIAPEEQEKVFEKFYRARGSEGAQDGKGLGLAISRRLARELGGDILVESRLGEGSRFTIKLPMMDNREPLPVNLTSDSDLSWDGVPPDQESDYLDGEPQKTTKSPKKPKRQESKSRDS